MGAESYRTSSGPELEMSSFLDMGDGSRLALDDYGHLQIRSEWTKAVADRFASEDEVSLENGHWLVIDILRDYYEDFGIETPMRALVKEMKLRGGEAFANSRVLYRLFPEGPVRQGSRYGGLPIPVSCI